MKNPFLRIFRLWALALLLGSLIRPGLADVSVFDMPERHFSHLRLLALMEGAHRSGEYPTMEMACRKGLELGTGDALWSYNLACALALQNKTEEALNALDRTINLGFSDIEHLRLDPDLASLRTSEAFQRRLEQLAAQPRTAATDAPASQTIRPDAQMTVTQSASNTVWNFQMGLFQASVTPSDRHADAAAYSGPETNTVRAWLLAGDAAGCDGLLYANRDGNSQPLDITRYPGLMRLNCAQEMIERRLNLGLPNTLFIDSRCNTLLPVIGHSSMGYLNSPYGRSQPRALCGDPRQTALQAVFLLANQLFFYPAYDDYDTVTGDRFPANTPYGFAVAGANNAEQPFLHAALAGLAALRPETRAELVRGGLLMPALHMLLRASQRTVKTRRDYLTGLAHPPVFQAANLDTARLVEMSHALTTNDLPPVVAISVMRETRMIPDRDFFDAVRTEQLFDSPLAVARVFRGAPRTRKLELLALCKRADARLHWVVLQGDARKVTFTPCPTNSSLMTLTVAHHEPFHAPLGNGQSIPTARVDIGVIAETPAGFSLPATVSFLFLGNERRVYADDGRIVSIDYTRREGGYTDPLLSYARNWKDCYQYDALGNLTGWRRLRGLTEEHFTAYGHKIVATDALGRATRAHLVRYVPRHVKTDESGETVTDLAQTDDNLEITYRYQSDSDFVGAPSRAAVTPETGSPASEP